MTALDSRGFPSPRKDSGGFQSVHEDSSRGFQSVHEDSSRGFQHARLIPTYSHSDEEDEADDCYEDIEDIRR